MASRWTQQQQQQQRQQQQWRQPGQMGMAAGGGGGLSRSRPSPMDARWSTGDSPPGLSLRTREDGGGEGAGGLEQSWLLGGGGGEVGDHSAHQPAWMRSSFDPRQWVGGGGESPDDWDGQALRTGWGGESGPPWPGGNNPSSPSQGGGGRGGSEKKGFYIVFAAANPVLNGRIFYDTFTEVNRFAINGMSAMSGAASFFMGAKSEEEARRALRERGFLGDGPVEAVCGRQPVSRPARRHY